MSPTAVFPETTGGLANAAMKHTIEKTAPSLKSMTNGTYSSLAELDAGKLTFTPNLNPKSVPELDSPEVWSQSVCSDHMITCAWTSTAGWHAPRLQPYGPLSLMPTASVLHYATECFEGMKVYRGFDGRLRLFRPDCNARRMLRSATRIALPAFIPEEFEKLVMALVSVDGEKWLPKSRPGSFLYIRPTMIGTGAALGVQRPKEALFYIILCCFPPFDDPRGTVTADPTHTTDAGIPAAPMRKPGLRLLASKDDMVRAWPGGFGYAKVGANYGPSLIAQGEARERGYDQILWLLGKHSEVTEAGASNFFVVWRTREGQLQLVTAPLGDKVILEGITRKSVLELARERLGEELECVERKFTMNDLVVAIEEGRLIEAFSSGTAFFISPISEIHYRAKDLDIPLETGVSGKYAALIKNWLQNIMYGKEDHPWGVVVEEESLEV
ncbi:hypothetical protein MMC17_002173 [Xylographa soralifera]|nr:hypothetical protein [Xylographa soralifera]